MDLEDRIERKRVMRRSEKRARKKISRESRTDDVVRLRKLVRRYVRKLG